MNKIYDQLAELDDDLNKVKDLQDSILDLYKINPKEYSKLLIKLNGIEEDLNRLKKDYELALNTL